MPSCGAGDHRKFNSTALLDISCVPETPLLRHNGCTARLSHHPRKGSRSFGLTHACQRRSVDTEGERPDAFCAPLILPTGGVQLTCLRKENGAKSTPAGRRSGVPGATYQSSEERGLTGACQAKITAIIVTRRTATASQKRTIPSNRIVCPQYVTRIRCERAALCVACQS